MNTSLLRILSFLLGPLTIIAVLKLVSGDDHIHVVAPTVLLVAWFILDLVRYLNPR